MFSMLAARAARSRRTGRGAGPWLLPEDEFHRLLDRERARADRASTAFSLVILDGTGAPGTTVQAALAILKERRRLTDDVGWFGSGAVGVLLPETGTAGAQTYLDNIHARLTEGGCDLPTQLFTYRGNSVEGAGPRGPGHGDRRRRTQSELPAVPQATDVAARSMEPLPSGAVASKTPLAAPQDLTPFFLKPLPGWKRMMDVAGSTVLLLLLSPLFAMVALAVRVTSRGPIIFRQQRAGMGGAPFTFYKFRTMFDGADAQKEALRAQNEVSGPVFKMKRDPRITPIGRILRRTSLDELPQLFNVLKGDMSLVGPRPPTLDEVPKYASWHRQRLDLIGGITGLWQVSGRTEVPFEEWMRMDIRYSRGRSMKLDFAILFKTMWAVVSGRGAQ